VQINRVLSHLVGWLVYLILLGGLLILYLPTIVYVCVGLYIASHLRKWAARPAFLRVGLFLALPLLLWEASRIQADWRYAEISEAIASVKVEPMPDFVPRAIEVNSYETRLAGGGRLKCIERVMWNKRLAAFRIKYEGPPLVELDPGSGKELGPASLPTTYLQFNSPPSVKQSISGGSAGDVYGPYELRIIGPNQDSLAGFQYDERIMKPAFPPVLTSGGWLFVSRLPPLQPRWLEPVEFVNLALGKCASTSHDKGNI